ncbi:hypothetical protein FRC04_004369 [Tulasnella sp. 424]|nr:hypothetical protein FRC04_004369 [Tulasnella sp. 424]KAG8979480.1 hypothetical protein FRC05_008469 [Tulasnella sp. 425]
MAAPERPPFNYDPAFKYTQQPNPDFKPVSGLKGSPFAEEWVKKGEEVGFTVVDPQTTAPGNLYRLLISGIVPRPIAFVSSIAPDGTQNLAPFSYFNVVNSDPPIVSVSFTVSAAGTKKKDTCNNILTNKTFTVNIISEPFVEAANWCAVDAPANVDEWYGSGLTKEKSTLVEPPRVKESAFSLECELYQSIELKHPDKPPGGILVLGLVKLIHVRNDVLNHPGDHPNATAGSAPRDWTVDPAKLRAVSRMGGITYGRIGEGFEVPRPVWAEVKDNYDGRSGVAGEH